MRRQCGTLSWPESEEKVMDNDFENRCREDIFISQLCLIIENKVDACMVRRRPNVQDRKAGINYYES